ncbi:MULTISPECIES: hypothetical protein [unclassified Streptomyces]|uniref:hypothetical protein n=1 Tax=unclassified Streptomyces TaxID=2593676 RepID=UPI0029A65903|nr:MULTISPECIES: hypothetical protein [unclassified Streptomyces]MDX3772228.1 hypothetical protein [Streptomyces sp. AK08-01B]MDX3821775.1 hypothetical protein [Streptomyces sp. AK08-01A]
MDSTAFPHDLVQAQYDWNTTYRALTTSGSRHTTALRRRLLDLSGRIWWHPFWTTVPGNASAARVELRRLARTQSGGGGAA